MTENLAIYWGLLTAEYENMYCLIDVGLCQCSFCVTIAITLAIGLKHISVESLLGEASRYN